jgi:hypothetical protein
MHEVSKEQIVLNIYSSVKIIGEIFLIIVISFVPLICFSQIKSVDVISQISQRDTEEQTDYDPLDSFKNTIYSQIGNFIYLSTDKLPVTQFTFNIKLGSDCQVESMSVSINANDSLKANLQKISRRLDFTDLTKFAKEMNWHNCDILVPFIVFYETDIRLSFIDSGKIASKTIVNSFSFDKSSFATRKSIVLKPKILGFSDLIR